MSEAPFRRAGSTGERECARCTARRRASELFFAADGTVVCAECLPTITVAPPRRGVVLKSALVALLVVLVVMMMFFVACGQGLGDGLRQFSR